MRRTFEHVSSGCWMHPTFCNATVMPCKSTGEDTGFWKDLGRVFNPTWRLRKAKVWGASVCRRARPVPKPSDGTTNALYASGCACALN